MNLGRTAVTVTVNGKRVPRRAGADAVGFEFTRTGSQARCRSASGPARERRARGIVVTGTEVLTGRVRDRNGPWLADRLLELGMDLAHITICGDRPEDMEAQLRFLADQGVDLIVTSGGLGPDRRRPDDGGGGGLPGPRRWPSTRRSRSGSRRSSSR